ncbi:MAG: rhodanese-like domain-containing protein [Acidimicrobiia bacterium]|jgi:rhodanese-related sulfurtransferase
MKALTALVALTLTLGACAGTQTMEPTLVDAAEAQELVASDPDVVVLDIRTPEEVAAGAIDGAQVLDFYSATFQAEIGELDRDTTYLVYCRSGNRSAQATQLMENLGFEDVYELEGGILAWANAGLALTGG